MLITLCYLASFRKAVKLLKLPSIVNKLETKNRIEKTKNSYENITQNIIRIDYGLCRLLDISKNTWAVNIGLCISSSISFRQYEKRCL